MIPHDLLRRLFHEFDTDADGRVSREEFLAGVSRGSSSSTTTAKVFQAADVSGVTVGGDAPPRVEDPPKRLPETNANGPAVSPAVSPAVLKGAQGEEHRKIKVYVAKDETRTAFRIKRTAPVPHFTCFTS
jgi:hypothetical protein